MPHRSNNNELRNYVDRYQSPVTDLMAFVDAMKDDIVYDHKKFADGEDSMVSQPRLAVMRKKVPFPVLLYRMLEESQENGTEHIVSWNRHGRSFQILDRCDFEQFVMPKYFQSNSFSTFARQTNHYKFGRISKGTYRGAFYHECFLRGRPDLLNQITRKSSTSSKRSFLALSSKDALVNTLPDSLPALPPDLDQLSHCHKLKPEQIVDLCVDPVCEPLRVFKFSGCAAMVGTYDNASQYDSFLIRS